MIIQSNVFVCEKCDEIVAITQSVSPFDDPVVVPPAGWGYAKDGNTYCCADCLVKEAC